LGSETLWGRLRRRTRVGRSLMRGVGDASNPGCLVDALSDLLVLLALVIVLAILVLVGIPLVLAILDLLFLAVLTLLGVTARVVFRRPWLVEARGPARHRVRWRVVGWRASGETVGAAADALAAGAPVPPGFETPDAPAAA
jgi:hypothetical protein